MNNFKVSGSNFLRIFTIAWRLYSRFVAIVERSFKSSFFVESIWRFLVSIGIYFNNSFIFRAADMKPKEDIIRESFFIAGFGKSYKRFESLLSGLARQSAFRDIFAESLHEFYFSPVKAVSILILVSIGVDALFSLFFHRGIDTWGWVFRISAAFLCLDAISCGADWAAVKGGSRLLDLLGKWQKRK